MPEQSNKKRYMPGLDGLRALSVIAVIVYHLPMNVLPGGFLGVGVFFVLSGYLITDQLVAKWKAERTLDLRGFWLRRARRLLPAMLLLVAVVSAWLAATDASRLHSLGGDIGAALAYIHNWWLIYHNVSYFESFGPPSPFGHFWSLAVEEQFYVLWPLLLALGLTIAPKRGPLALLIIGGAAASAMAMAYLYAPGTDPSRVYYGTDTRAFGLLIGAALAVILPSAGLKPIESGRGRFLMDGIGSAALIAIALMAFFTNEYGSFTYRGGLALLSVVTAILIAVLIHPSSRLAQALSIKPLRWIGVRSYGIYLWHYPVIALTSEANTAGGADYPRIAFQLWLTLLLAALSWNFVERPIIGGALGRLFRRVTSRPASSGGGAAWRALHPRAFALLSVSAIFALCISCGSGSGERPGASAEAAGTPPVVQAPSPSGDPDLELVSGGADSSPSASGKPGASPSSPSEPEATPGSSQAAKPGEKEPTVKQPDGSESNGSQSNGANSNGTNSNGTNSNGAGINGTNSNGANPGGASPTGSQPGGTQPGASGSNAAKPNEAQPDGTNSASATPQADGKGVTVIGDSVILGVKPYLEKLLPGILVDGEVGRQMNKAMDTVEALQSGGDIGKVVVIELGTNGSFTEKKLKQILDELGDDRSIILINTRVPRQWQDPVNKTLKEVAADYENVSMIDWYRASAGKEEYFGKDGVHLTRTGAEAYADLVAKELASVREA